jgi:hypothetical protein
MTALPAAEAAIEEAWRKALPVEMTPAPAAAGSDTAQFAQESPLRSACARAES